MNNCTIVYRNNRYEIQNNRILSNENCDYIRLNCYTLSMHIKSNHTTYIIYSNGNFYLMHNYYREDLGPIFMNNKGKILSTFSISKEMLKFCENALTGDEEARIEKVKSLHGMLRKLCTEDVSQEELDGIRFSNTKSAKSFFEFLFL
jgi:hypothetical protein